MHYGHPDMMSKACMMQQGGISKATKTINLSEDIFAGMDFTLRGAGRTIGHREYFHLTKGRDLGFNSVLGFFSKLSGGTGEQILTRQMFRLGQAMDLPEFLTFYYAHAGYYVTQFLLSQCIPALVFLWLTVLLNDTNMIVKQKLGPKLVAETMADMLVAESSWLVLIFLVAQSAPLFAEVWLQHGLLPACWRLLKQTLTLAPLHFIFQAKIIGIYFSREIRHGGGAYVSTGRGLPTERRPFIGNNGGLYNDFAVATFYDGVRLLLAIIAVAIVGGFNVSKNKLAFWCVLLALTVASWLFAPFLFNPYQFAHRYFAADIREWRRFFIHDRGSSWEAWYRRTQLKENEGIRLGPLTVILWLIFVGSWYTLFHAKIHMLRVVYPGGQVAAAMHIFSMLPPVLCSMTCCIVAELIAHWLRRSRPGFRVHVCLMAAIVIVVDTCETLFALKRLLAVNWWMTALTGVILKFSFLTLMLVCCECLLSLRCFVRCCLVCKLPKTSLELWLLAHRLAADALISAFIFLVLSVGVLWDWLRSTLCCTSCSLHNLLIFRDPGQLAHDEEELQSQMTATMGSLDLFWRRDLELARD